MAAPYSDEDQEGQDDDIDDLAGIDLSSLDLDHIDLDDTPGEAWRWIGLVLLAGAMGLILWLPSTEWFRLLGRDSSASFVLAGVGIFVGILLGRWIWLWGVAAAKRYAARALPHQPKVQKPPSALQRWLTLAAVIGGGAVILYVPASSYYQPGEHYESNWFLAAGGAVVVGIVLGRWLLMQAAASRPATQERRVFTLPPWFKWVTLSILGLTAIVVLIGKLASGGEAAGAFDFSFGAVGFIAGIGGAIWLARRFDEWESRHQAKLVKLSPATSAAPRSASPPPASRLGHGPAK